MKILPVHQHTPAWYAARAKYYRTASRAPIIMGTSLYGVTRNDLMAEIKTGISREVDTQTQALFDAGHAAEESARKIVEHYLKAPLLPLTCLTDDEYLLASFDGICEDLRVWWEHKIWNEKLAAQVRAKQLDPYHYWQLEHQAIVCNLDYVIFMCSDGTKERAAYFKYIPVPGRREQLLAGWQQFDIDLAAYRHVEVIPATVAAPVMALPTLFVQARGEVTNTNMPDFKAQITKFIGALNMTPVTDQEFADSKEIAKKLRELAVKIKERKTDMLAQTATIGEIATEIDHLAEVVNTSALQLEKAVEREENSRKLRVVTEGQTKLAEHITKLNIRLGAPYMPIITADFGGAIKGKRLITAMEDAIATLLANQKIEANAVADRIEINLNCLRETAKDHAFLFADTAQIVLKANDDFAALVKLRISEHQAGEEKRLEAEREKIRREEQERAEQRVKDAAAAQANTTAKQDYRPIEDIPGSKDESVCPIEPVSGKSGHMPVPVAAPVDPVIAHQEIIRAFLDTLKAGEKKKNEIRGYLVEFIKFMAKSGGGRHG